ncbi:MAG: hypothetical protein QM784_40765 [Polyangiaceae bacterium]
MRPEPRARISSNTASEAKSGPQEMSRHGVLEVPHRHRFEWPDLDQARYIDENVDPPEKPACRTHRGIDLRAPLDVTLHAKHATVQRTARGSDCLLRVGEFFRVSRSNDDCGSPLNEAMRQQQPQAPGSSEHQYALPPPVEATSTKDPYAGRRSHENSNRDDYGSAIRVNETP